jgi:hypothetical protein
MIGQHREKQVDRAHPGEALLLHAPENGDPPRWQEVVSCAEAKHYAIPSFFEEFRHCGRDECHSEAASDKLHGVLNFAYLERSSALKATPHEYLIDESSEGAVGSQVDKDLLGECFERHAAARGKWMIA